MTDYLALVEALAIYRDRIARYGGAAGLRDGGLLEAALFRPQTGYYADPIEEAAALWESVSQNPPFIAGDKPTAFAVTYPFLALNGAAISASSDDTYAFIAQSYESGTFDFEHLASWVRENVVWISAPGI